MRARVLPGWPLWPSCGCRPLRLAPDVSTSPSPQSRNPPTGLFKGGPEPLRWLVHPAALPLDSSAHIYDCFVGIKPLDNFKALVVNCFPERWTHPSPLPSNGQPNECRVHCPRGTVGADPAPWECPRGWSLPACVWEQSGGRGRTVARPMGHSRLAVASTNRGPARTPGFLCPLLVPPGQVELLRPLCLGPGPCGQGEGANSWAALEVPQNACAHQLPAQSRGGPGSPACYFWRSQGSGRLVLQLRVGTEASAPELDSLGPRSHGVGARDRKEAAGSPRPWSVLEAPPSVAR